MAGLRRILTKRYRRRWGVSIAVIALIVIASFVCLWLVDRGELSSTPWAYIAVGATLLGAVTALALTVYEAKVEDDLSGSLSRRRNARRIRKHHQHE